MTVDDDHLVHVGGDPAEHVRQVLGLVERRDDHADARRPRSGRVVGDAGRRWNQGEFGPDLLELGHLELGGLAVADLQAVGVGGCRILGRERAPGALDGPDDPPLEGIDRASGRCVVVEIGEVAVQGHDGPLF